MRKKRNYFPLWLVGAIIVLLGVTWALNAASKSTPLTAMSNAELTSFLSQGQTGFVYIGRPTCPVCKEFQPKLERAMKQEAVQVHYYNTADARAEDESQLAALMNGLQVQGVPTLMYVEQGKEVDRLKEGELTLDDITAFIQKHKQ